MGGWTLMLWAAVAVGALSKPTAAQAVRAEAKVEVSSGRNFIAVMRYAAPDDVEYLRRTPDGESRYTVDRQGVWLTGSKGREQLDAQIALWVLSHNFHAEMLYFDALNGGSTRHAFVEAGCDCDELRGPRAAPALGIEYLSLIVERQGGRPRKLLVRRKDDGPVVSVYSDWRTSLGRSLPFAVDVDDGIDRYAFRFTTITVE